MKINDASYRLLRFSNDNEFIIFFQRSDKTTLKKVSKICRSSFDWHWQIIQKLIENVDWIVFVFLHSFFKSFKNKHIIKNATKLKNAIDSDDKMRCDCKTKISIILTNAKWKFVTINCNLTKINVDTNKMNVEIQ